MRSRFRYYRPTSLSEALDFLALHGTDTAIVAGGTDLMISARSGDLQCKYVLDVSRLNELRPVAMSDGLLAIGSAVTHAEIAAHPVTRDVAPVLAKAASCVGSTQIRNMGTIGGNIANASPAADTIPPLMVHNAKIVVKSASGERVEYLGDFVRGPYVTILKPGELITHVLLEPMMSGYRHSFQRIARRRALSIARMNVAALGLVDGNGVIQDLRLSVGSVTPRPCRMTVAEDVLTSNKPDKKVFWEAAEKVSHEMVRWSGIRPTTEYKKPAVEGLVYRALADLFLSEG
ncbi:MAG: xanthine dehydrogenase family protein subunit M [Desulfomonile sp.]|nr:xanthine dehydrogenase family protein subunit M [Desulfomonile sp.]